jgi:hypothetical protein
VFTSSLLGLGDDLESLKEKRPRVYKFILQKFNDKKAVDFTLKMVEQADKMLSGKTSMAEAEKHLEETMDPELIRFRR